MKPAQNAITAPPTSTRRIVMVPSPIMVYEDRAMTRFALTLALLAGCLGDEVTDDEAIAETGDDEDTVLDDPDPEGKADGVTTIWYTPITREYFLPSAKITTETRKLFKSEAEWVAHFGQPSPGIDFVHNWAVFYTPGTQSTDLATTTGWRSKLSRVSLSSTGKTVSITTRLERDGDSCPWRRATPFVTATIPKPAAATYKRFYKSDTQCPACN
jgi:hypothetical protein